MTRNAEGSGANELVAKINKIVREGNVRRIVVRNAKGRTVLDIPVTVGVVAVAIWPMITVAAGATALAGGWKLEVERTEPPASATESSEVDG